MCSAAFQPSHVRAPQLADSVLVLSRRIRHYLQTPIRINLNWKRPDGLICEICREKQSVKNTVITQMVLTPFVCTWSTNCVVSICMRKLLVNYRRRSSLRLSNSADFTPVSNNGTKHWYISIGSIWKWLRNSPCVKHRYLKQYCTFRFVRSWRLAA